MNHEKIRNEILENQTSLGIELGSTRIKAVLIGQDHTPLATGSHDWENQLIDGIWTYDLADAWRGVQECYANLAQDVQETYGVPLTSVGSIGISGMMHGYVVFDEKGEQLAEFRTWRNTITAQSSDVLIPLFGYPIPHRWSISHLYQAILNGEAHVPEIAHITTLAGYIHWKLTGEQAIGVGEASGMFPIDLASKKFNETMLDQFDALIKPHAYPWEIRTILPRVLSAGASAGSLTETGAKLLDPTGNLQAGIPFCPPEGDAGTGMVATNSVAPRTGNVSAGTSIFLMAVLERDLQQVHPEIDLVTTPDGSLVAMVHCNNCTGDIDAWVKLFAEFAKAAGLDLDKTGLYKMLYGKATEADPDCGGLLSYNYVSGESITELEEGRPLFVRRPNDNFTLANFMRMNLYSALGTLKIGYDILEKEENVTLEKVYGHGGFFKTEAVGQQMMAAALNTPVTVMETAGEGGPWGMAVLASYMQNKQADETLQEYLDHKVFATAAASTLKPQQADVDGFGTFMEQYKKGLAVERLAVETL